VVTEPQMYRLLVTGSRGYDDVLSLQAALVKVYQGRPRGSVLVVVTDWDENPAYCSGAASIARQWAIEQQEAQFAVQVESWPAGWEGPCEESCTHLDRRVWQDVSLCPEAGQRRNEEMCASGIGAALGAMRVGEDSTNAKDCLARLFRRNIEFELIIQGHGQGLPRDLVSGRSRPR